MTGPNRFHVSEPLDYEMAKKLVRSQDAADRLKVAVRPDVRAELLYYLANDSAAEVRRQIAANAATPRQADLVLSKDRDDEVRGGLALKIARLVPNLPSDQLGQIERMTVDILETLARDQVTEVRRILADTLKDVYNAPASVINRLARDIELVVAGPVLRHSPILTDDDLLEIIRSGPVAGALSAIAERAGVPASVAEAIAASDDPGAVAVLLANPSAQIREETLDRIVELAPQHEPWHAPLVRRPRLSARVAARLAGFVTETLVRALQSRTDLDPGVAREIAKAVQRRLGTGGAAAGAPSAGASPVGAFQDAAPGAAAGGPAGAAGTPIEGGVTAGASAVAEAEAPQERPSDKAARLAKEGKLDEKLLNGALAEGDRGFLLASLSVLTGLDLGAVDRIMATHSPRAVTALVWKAGLSMRFARQVQLRLAQIPPKTALNPRDGVDYPLSEAEMRWQLEFFGAG
ncbi:MAG: DUF2336 domain-containing protein [Azospirillum sp.]|nr:DUF2336 domain-containing protein [Azospirillum sp.]